MYMYNTHTRLREPLVPRRYKKHITKRCRSPVVHIIGYYVIVTCAAAVAVVAIKMKKPKNKKIGYPLEY